MALDGDTASTPPIKRDYRDVEWDVAASFWTWSANLARFGPRVTVPLRPQFLYLYTYYTDIVMARARKKSEPTTAIPVRFTKKELLRMERARSLLGLASRSAFMREAILEKLHAVETMGVIELRDITVDQAVRLINRYMRKYPGIHYPSDFMEKLGIEPKTAIEAVQRLIDDGQAHEVAE